MARYLSTLFLLLLTQLALSNDISTDPSFFNETEGPADVIEKPSPVVPKEMAYHLLNVVWEHLLSNNEHDNMLAQILIKDKGSLDDVKGELDAILNPFVEQNPKLAPQIHLFKTNVLNKIRSLPKNWDSIKNTIPALKIYCTELIDRVTTIF
ncbi:MAG: hypothetical protein ACSW8C_01095 [bacterium]